MTLIKIDFFIIVINMNTARIAELADVAASTRTERLQYEETRDTQPHKLILFRMHHRYKLMYQLQALFHNKEDIIDYMARIEEFTLFNEYPEYGEYIAGANTVRLSILSANSDILQYQEQENISLAVHGMTREEYDAALVLAAIGNVLEHN
jgi:hypothetical protein